MNAAPLVRRPAEDAAPAPVRPRALARLDAIGAYVDTDLGADGATAVHMHIDIGALGVFLEMSPDEARALAAGLASVAAYADNLTAEAGVAECAR